MKTILVSGCCGFIGQNLVSKLLKDYNIIGIDNFSSSSRANLKKLQEFENFKFIEANIINPFIIKDKVDYIFNLACPASPPKYQSDPIFTLETNFIGTHNLLKIAKENKSIFIQASTSEIYGDPKIHPQVESYRGNVNTIGKRSCYDEGKRIAETLCYEYREKYNLKSYNAVIFNTESIYRPKNYLIPKICMAAINAKKNNLKTKFGNIKIGREWNWCEEQCKYLLKFIQKKPQDFILSNGKFFSANQMLKFAFEYFKLDYKKFILLDKKFIRKADSNIKKSNFLSCQRKNKIKRIDKIYGKKIIYKIIKHYLNEKKY